MLASDPMRGRAAAVLGAVALLGCSRDVLPSGRQLVWGASVPGSTTPARVTSVAVRGDYLDAVLESEVFRLRFLLPDTERCRGVVERDAQVDFVRLRLFGVVKRGQERCEPVGIADLAAWRDQRTRPRRFDPLPRAQATFYVTYSDEEVVLVRGRFPLATEIGLTGSSDLVAMLPNAPECLGPLEEGVASMEFRDAGAPAYVLVASEGLCPLLGFALPIRLRGDPTRPAEPDAS